MQQKHTESYLEDVIFWRNTRIAKEKTKVKTPSVLKFLHYIITLELVLSSIKVQQLATAVHFVLCKTSNHIREPSCDALLFNYLCLINLLKNKERPP